MNRLLIVYAAVFSFSAQLMLILGLVVQRAWRRRAEEQRRRLEVRNTALLRAIPDVMFVLARDGTYVDYHARLPRLLPFAPGSFIGRTVRDVMPPQVAETLMNAIERTSEDGDPVVVEYQLLHGDPKYFEARFVPIEQDYVLSIVRDVTDVKRGAARNRDLAGRLIASQELERTRIARDLHDDVCQEIAALSIDVSQLRQNLAKMQSREIHTVLVSLQQRTASLAESLRRLSHGLHSSVLHHIGLMPALQAHCAEVERQHHMEVRFAAEGDVEPASRSVALSLFRIAQEALGNATRHGHAQHATVSLFRRNGELTLEVADDGQGFNVPIAQQNGGLGLVSMEERARFVHGSVSIRSQPGTGTNILVRVPADEGNAAHHTTH